MPSDAFLSGLLNLPDSPPFLETVMTVGRTANCHSGIRSLAGVPRNGSDCCSGCRTLGPPEGVLVLLGLRGRSICRLRLR